MKYYKSLDMVKFEQGMKPCVKCGFRATTKINGNRAIVDNRVMKVVAWACDKCWASVCRELKQKGVL